MWCLYCDKTTTIEPIAQQLSCSIVEKVTACFESKAVPRKKSSLFEEITHSKDNISLRTLNTMKRHLCNN
jgi:hypothetical protein